MRGAITIQRFSKGRWIDVASIALAGDPSKGLAVEFGRGTDSALARILELESPNMRVGRRPGLASTVT